MQRISIKNFGPIDSMTIDIEPINVFVGPQASGKSTVSKLIFFFRSIPEALYEFLLEESVKEDEVLYKFNKVLIQKFIGYFGTTKHMRPFEITYIYNEKKYVKLYPKDGFLQITFSQRLKKPIYKAAEQMEEIKEYTEKESNVWDTTLSNVHAKKKYTLLRNQIYDSFEETLTPIFIPAGRSLVSTLTDQLQLMQPGDVDDIMKQFIERILSLRKTFSRSLEDVIEDKKNLTNQEIDMPNVMLAAEIIEKIIKGKYIYQTDGERIYFNEHEFIKLNFSSSGQQEVVWIALLIFSIILEKRNVFMVIEEPEAHLFPSAQHHIVALIVLLVNTSDSEVIITSHSPYILSSLNTYIYAGQLSDKLDKVDENLISKPLRIRKKVGAYYVERGEKKFLSRDIIDAELQLIQAEVIDNISNEINELFDKLTDIEVSL